VCRRHAGSSEGSRGPPSSLPATPSHPHTTKPGPGRASPAAYGPPGGRGCRRLLGAAGAGAARWLVRCAVLVNSSSAAGAAGGPAGALCVPPGRFCAAPPSVAGAGGPARTTCTPSDRFRAVPGAFCREGSCRPQPLALNGGRTPPHCQGASCGAVPVPRMPACRPAVARPAGS
jgi:hypothetical protein